MEYVDPARRLAVYKSKTAECIRCCYWECFQNQSEDVCKTQTFCLTKWIVNQWMVSKQCGRYQREDALPVFFTLVNPQAIEFATVIGWVWVWRMSQVLGVRNCSPNTWPSNQYLYWFRLCDAPVVIKNRRIFCGISKKILIEPSSFCFF